MRNLGIVFSIIISAVFAITYNGAASADTSCNQEIGATKAKQLAQQCLQISAATHPPCNPQNSCAMIQSEIDSGCDLAKSMGGSVPSFCKVAQNNISPTIQLLQTDSSDNTFKSPSGNIACAFGGDGSEKFPSDVRCDIYQFTPSNQVPAELKNDPIFPCSSPKEMRSFHVSTANQTAGMNCPSDALDDSKILAYGQSISNRGITCKSEQTGMTCTNNSGHGFSLSKAQQRVF